MDALLAHLNIRYGLNVSFVEKVAKGFLSENSVLMGNGKKFFLKKYRFDTAERMREVHAVKKYFADNGIPAILPIVDNEGNTFFFFQGGYYALFPFVDGRQVERGVLTDSEIISLGELHGRMHLLGKNTPVIINERFKFWDKERALGKIELIEKEMQKKSVRDDFDTLAQKSIDMKKNFILSNTIRYEDVELPSDTLIHGDYLDQNVFFNSAGSVSHVFDFEKTDYSPRMFEVWRSLAYTFLLQVVTQKDIQKARLYLDTYKQIYPTSKDELARGFHLFYLKAMHGVWTESEHYVKNSTRTDEFLLSDFSRLLYLTQNFNAFQRLMLD